MEYLVLAKSMKRILFILAACRAPRLGKRRRAFLQKDGCFLVKRWSAFPEKARRLFSKGAQGA